MASVSVPAATSPSSSPHTHHHAHRPPRRSSISSSSTGAADGPPLIHLTPVAPSAAAPPLGPFTRSYTVPAPPHRSKLPGSGLKSFMSASSSRASSPSPLSSSSSSSRRHSLPGADSGNPSECARWARVVAAARAISANVDATKFSISNTLADTQSSTTQSLLARSSSSPSPSPSPTSAAPSAAAATRLSATSRVLSRLIHDLRLEVDDDLVQLDRAIIDLVYHARKLVLSGTVPGVVPMATLLDTLAACERGVASVATAVGELCTKLEDMCVCAMAQAAGEVDGADVRRVFADMHIARAHFISQLEVADSTRLAPPSAQVPKELVNIVHLQASIRDAALTLNRLDQAVKRAPGMICQATGHPSTPSPPATTGALRRSASSSALHSKRPASILATFSSMFSSSAHSSRSPSPSARSVSSPHRLSISSTASSDSTLMADEDQVQSPTQVDSPGLVAPAAGGKHGNKEKRMERARSLSPIRESRAGSAGGFGKWKRSMMSAMHHVLHPTAAAGGGGGKHHGAS